MSYLAILTKIQKHDILKNINIVYFYPKAVTHRKEEEMKKMAVLFFVLFFCSSCHLPDKVWLEGDEDLPEDQECEEASDCGVPRETGKVFACEEGYCIIKEVK